MEPKLIDSVRNLLETLIKGLGPDIFLALVVIICIFSFGWKWYSDYLKRKETNEALQEKERTIQRLTNEIRTWRSAILKEKFDWSDEQIKNFLITENFSNPQEARDYLLGNKKDIKENNRNE